MFLALNLFYRVWISPQHRLTEVHLEENWDYRVLSHCPCAAQSMPRFGCLKLTRGWVSERQIV